MFIILVNKLLPDRIGFGPMESDALARYGIMRKMGVFGIDSQSRRGAEKFLRTGVQILSDPRSVLFVTAEGMFVDPRHRPIRLRGGVAHLTKRVPNAVILPLALEYTFWNERKPEALAHFGQPLDSSTSASIADCIRHLEEHLTDAVETLAAASMTRDPGLFHELLRGRSGIGGVYDVWRHGAALLQGERFSASHEERG